MQLSTETNNQPSDQLTNSIANMFVEWQILYDNKMKAEDWGLETIERWAKILTKLKITKSEFDRSEEAAELLGGWPIKHPADFLALGRTDTASNYPDMRAEYLAAAQGQYKHEVTLETAKRVGTWQLKTQPESTSYKLWQSHYPKVCKEHSEGADFKVSRDKWIKPPKHEPVKAGSAADKQITEKLAQLRRMAV